MNVELGVSVVAHPQAQVRSVHFWPRRRGYITSTPKSDKKA